MTAHRKGLRAKEQRWLCSVLVRALASAVIGKTVVGDVLIGQPLGRTEADALAEGAFAESEVALYRSRWVSEAVGRTRLACAEPQERTHRRD